MNACFSKSEARGQIGAEVATVVELPDVPVGSRGRVVDADDGGFRGWILRVQWDLPPKRSEMLAQLGEFSFNVPWRSKRPTAEFSKSEAERFLKRVQT